MKIQASRRLRLLSLRIGSVGMEDMALTAFRTGFKRSPKGYVKVLNIPIAGKPESAIAKDLTAELEKLDRHFRTIGFVRKTVVRGKKFEYSDGQFAIRANIECDQQNCIITMELGKA